MIDVAPQNLLLEIEAAERLRDEHVSCADKLVRAYVGSAYRQSWTHAEPRPENHSYEFISLMLGRLVADNPAVACTSKLRQYDGIAAGLEDALNQWIINADLQTILEGVVTDSFFCFGVTITTFEPDLDAPATDDGLQLMRPRLVHLPYWRYFRDPTSCAGIPPRFEGHVWFKDKEDLLNDPRYDREAVEALVADSDLAKISPAMNKAGAPPRNQIVGYEIYVPDVQTGDDPDTHGTIYTLATIVNNQGERVTKDGKSVGGYLCKPRAYFGRASGPYTLFGGWPVPGSPYPLSPLAVTKEQSDELNAHTIALTRTALNMKDIVLVDSGNTGLKDTIKSTKHGHVAGVKGYRKGMADQITISGPSPVQMEYTAALRDRLDRVSGINDAMRGNLDPGVTATANNLAAQSNTVRVDTQVKFVKRATAHCLRNVAWFMFHSEFFAAPLSHDSAEKFGMQAPVFVGGKHPSTADLRFEDLFLDIQPYSMERVDPAVMQARVQQVTALIVQMAEAMPRMPWVNWEDLIAQLARAHNFNWIKDIINSDALQQVMQSMQQPPRPEPKVPTLNYTDVPPDVKSQIEAQYGLQPSKLWSVVPLYDPDQPKLSGDASLSFAVPQNGAGDIANPQHMLARMLGAAGAPGTGMHPQARHPSSAGAPANAA